MKSFKKFLLEKADEQEYYKNNETSDQEIEVSQDEDLEDQLKRKEESYPTQKGRRAANTIDKDYNILKAGEDLGGMDAPVKSTDINPNRVSATDDYDYWKDAIVGKKGTADSDQLYDWMWRMARHKAYPYQEKERTEMTPEQLRDARMRYGGNAIDDIILPDPSEPPIPVKEKDPFDDEEKEIRKSMQGAKPEDIERVVIQAKEDFYKDRE